MSELSLFANGLPAHLRNAELDETTKALMGSGTGTYKRISIKGSVFRMVVNGKEVAKNEDRAMNVVIVAAAPKNARTYYSKTYTEGEALRPDCTSADGVTPDASIENPQASGCAACPQNIAGSGQNGSRACRYSRRLAAMLENDLITGDIYQLVLPAQSIFGQGENGKLPLESYARYLGGQGVSVSAVVTEMRFDTNSATPKLTFRAIRALNEEEYAVAMEKGQGKEAQNAISFDPAALDNAGKSKAAPAPAPVEAPVVAMASPEEPVKRESKKATETPTPKSVEAVLDDWD
jgi:hypothetical protein